MKYTQSIGSGAKSGRLNGWPRLIRALICLNLIGLAGIWLNSAYAAERGAALLMAPEHPNGHMNERPPTPAFITSTKIETVITGHIVRSNVTQTFENPTSYWMEGLYTFPLPEGAAVDGMILKIGDRRIVSEIQEKSKAKRIYEEAAAEGKISALLDQYRPNVFSTRIANIEPGSKISVEISFQMLAAQNGTSFSWHMPQVITQRYNPDVKSERQNDTALPIMDGSSGINAHSVSEFSVLIKQGDQLASLESPSHEIHKEGVEGGDVLLTLRRGLVPVDRDFVLDWKFEQGAVAKTLLFEEEKAGESYILGILLPPSETVSLPYMRRDVTFILDISGSMQGAAIEQGKAALTSALKQLRSTDRFDILAFNDEYYRLFGNSRLATPANVQRAIEYVNDLQAERGTEMYPALKSALQTLSRDGFLWQIVFLTDGAVSNEEQMFDLVDRELGDGRLFTVGLGHAPNGWFMRKAAEFGRGIHVQIDKVENARSELEDLFKDMSRPTLEKIQLDTGSAADTYPKVIPDLFGQRPLIFLSHHRNTEIPLSVKAKDSSGRLVTLPIKAQPQQTNASISKLWAAKKIEGLRDAARRGMDINIVRSGILKVALHHQIMSPYTSFVAVDKTPVRVLDDLLRKAKFMKSRPTALAFKKINGPQTATAMVLSLWIGIGAALFSCLLFFILYRTGRTHV